MGIKINVNAKQDYSYLFQNLSTGSGSSLGNLNFLSDYASIKNGSYGKLMKAYYAKNSNSNVKAAADEKKTDTKKSISTSSDTAKTLSEIEKSADTMKESADKLLTKGTKSVFAKKNVTTKDEYGFDTTTREYDTEAIYKAVADFTKSYNNLLDKVADSESTTILNKGTSLVNMTKANEKLLSDIGITIGKDNTLTINEETFKKADMNTVKNLFNSTGSYGYNVSSQASMIDYAAGRESDKANTYTGFGTYSNAYSSGSILDSLF